MNFKFRDELTVDIDDWYLFLLWFGHPFDEIVQERTEWLEENIESSLADQTYALWCVPAGTDINNGPLAHYYVSINHDIDAVAYKLRWAD